MSVPIETTLLSDLAASRYARAIVTLNTSENAVSSPLLKSLKLRGDPTP